MQLQMHLSGMYFTVFKREIIMGVSGETLRDTCFNLMWKHSYCTSYQGKHYCCCRMQEDHSDT